MTNEYRYNISIATQYISINTAVDNGQKNRRTYVPYHQFRYLQLTQKRQNSLYCKTIVLAIPLYQNISLNATDPFRTWPSGPFVSFQRHWPHISHRTSRILRKTPLLLPVQKGSICGGERRSSRVFSVSFQLMVQLLK